MEALEEETYADLVRPEIMEDVELQKSPPTFSTQPAMTARRYRLSLSPLDSLQAEFKKYNHREQSETLPLSQPPNQRSYVSAVLRRCSLSISRTSVRVRCCNTSLKALCKPLMHGGSSLDTPLLLQ